MNGLSQFLSNSLEPSLNILLEVKRKKTVLDARRRKFLRPRRTLRYDAGVKISCNKADEIVLFFFFKDKVVEAGLIANLRPLFCLVP